MLRLNEFLTQLRQCNSKAAQAEFIKSEISCIKKSFEKQEANYRARNMAKLLYLKTCQQIIDFGDRQTVQLIGSKFIIEKKLGYLALTQLMSVKVINEAADLIKGDLSSTNFKHRALALCAISSIIETAPNLIEYLKIEMQNCIKSSNHLVQKKAILTVSRAAKVDPESSRHFTSTILNAIRLNQNHLLSECLVFFGNVLRSKQGEFITNKINQLIPQILTIYSSYYENVKSKQQLQKQKFVVQALLKFFQSFKHNETIQKFLSEYIDALLTNQSKLQSLPQLCYSLLRFAVYLPVNKKNIDLVLKLLKGVLILKNANKLYISLQALKLASQFEPGILMQQKNFIFSSLQTSDLSLRVQAISLIYSMIQNCQGLQIEECRFFKMAIQIAEALQTKGHTLKYRYSALVKVLIMIIQSQSSQFIFAIIEQLRSIQKLENLELTSLFFPNIAKNPVDHFFSIMTFLIQEWAKTIQAIEEDFEVLDERQILMQGKVLTVMQSIYALQNIQKTTLIKRIPLLHTISQKISNKFRIRQIALKLSKLSDKSIATPASQVLAKIDDSFPKSAVIFNESSIRPLKYKQRKSSRHRINSYSSQQQQIIHDQSCLLKEIEDSNQTIQSLYDKVIPIKIQILLNQTGCTEIELGNARILEVLFYSGFDDRNNDSFKNVTERQIKWSVQPQGIVQIDMYGRLKSLKAGNVEISVQSLANQQAKDSKRICVTDSKLKKAKQIKKRIVKYEGTPAEQVFNWQKIVFRYQNSQIQINQDIPKHIKGLIFSNKSKQSFTKNSVTWSIQKFADGSDGKYVKRVDQALQQGNRDRVQYFMGDRYLPDDGKSPQSISADQQQGVWVIGKSGNINHITMNKISYFNKAIMMSKDTDKYVSRYGLASGAYWNGQRWETSVSDNDGLWTGMYGVGELMRYHSLRNSKAPVQVVKQGRKSALKALKAVLLIANVSGRNGTVKSTIRYLTNTRLGTGYWYSDYCLKEGKFLMTDVFVGNPYEGISFYGVDAGKVTDGHYCGGKYRYNMEAINRQDWVKYQQKGSTPVAKTEKTVKGYISRSFAIKQIDKVGGGLFLQRNADGSQTVLQSAGTLYDYTDSDHPVLNIGNLPVPEVLKDVIFVNGKQYEAKDLIYKADCSSDEIIGHLFIYKVGFDVMDENDPEQKTVKNLIRETVVNYSQHLLDNGYTEVDATGQPTKWGKSNRQFFNSDASIEQGNMLSLILLVTFKLAFYMTGQSRWQDQYLLLVNHKALKFLDFSTTYWERWMYMILNEDNNSYNFDLFRLKQEDHPSDAEKLAHAMYCVHYSDEQMAMLVFYLAFQLETDPQLLKKYQKGLDAWWVSVSHSQNPLWYYIYQLSKPKQKVQDAYGNDILQTSAWQLSRHPISTIQYKAYFDGSRPDVLKDFRHSVDPTKKLGTRTSKTDTQNANYPFNFKVDPNYDPKNIYQIKVLPADQRSVHKMNGTTFRDIESSNSTSMQPATTYTLPYWFGVYHGMLKLNYE